MGLASRPHAKPPPFLPTFRLPPTEGTIIPVMGRRAPQQFGEDSPHNGNEIYGQLKHVIGIPKAGLRPRRMQRSGRTLCRRVSVRIAYGQSPLLP